MSVFEAKQRSFTIWGKLIQLVYRPSFGSVLFESIIPYICESCLCLLAKHLPRFYILKMILSSNPKFPFLRCLSLSGTLCKAINSLSQIDVYLEMDFIIPVGQ